MVHLFHYVTEGQSGDLSLDETMNFMLFFFADSISYFSNQKKEISTLDKVSAINTHTHIDLKPKALVNRLLLVSCLSQWCCVEECCRPPPTPPALMHSSPQPEECISCLPPLLCFIVPFSSP